MRPARGWHRPWGSVVRPGRWATAGTLGAPVSRADPDASPGLAGTSAPCRLAVAFRAFADEAGVGLGFVCAVHGGGSHVRVPLVPPGLLAGPAGVNRGELRGSRPGGPSPRRGRRWPRRCEGVTGSAADRRPPCCSARPIIKSLDFGSQPTRPTLHLPGRQPPRRLRRPKPLLAGGSAANRAKTAVPATFAEIASVREDGAIVRMHDGKCRPSERTRSRGRGPSWLGWGEWSP